MGYHLRKGRDCRQSSRAYALGGLREDSERASWERVGRPRKKADQTGFESTKLMEAFLRNLCRRRPAPPRKCASRLETLEEA